MTALYAALRRQVTQSCNSLWPHGLSPTRLLCPWDSPGKNPGVGGHALLQGIFPTQGSDPGLPHCRILYHISHQGSPRILEWVVYSFSKGTSQPRNPIRVTCIAGGFITSWATREAHGIMGLYLHWETKKNSLWFALWWWSVTESATSLRSEGM